MCDGDPFPNIKQELSPIKAKHNYADHDPYSHPHPISPIFPHYNYSSTSQTSLHGYNHDFIGLLHAHVQKQEVNGVHYQGVCSLYSVSMDTCGLLVDSIPFINLH